MSESEKPKPQPAKPVPLKPTPPPPQPIIPGQTPFDNEKAIQGEHSSPHVPIAKAYDGPKPAPADPKQSDSKKK